MASSTDSHSNSHDKESTFQSMSKENLELLLKIVPLMEGKSEDERQALLDTLNSLTKSPSIKKTTDSVDRGNEVEPKSDEAEHSNKEQSLESLGQVNHSIDEDNKTAAKEKDIVVKDQGSYKDINGSVKEENLALNDQEPHEPVEEVKKETAHSHEVPNEIPNVQKQNQGAPAEEIKDKTNTSSFNDDGIQQTPDMKNKNKDEEKNTLTVTYKKVPDEDESKNSLESSDFQGGKEHEETVASSDDDMPPSTPASGEHSSGSDLSESPSERDSTTRIEPERRDPSTVPTPNHQHEGLPYSQAEMLQSLRHANLTDTFEKAPQSKYSPIITQENSHPATWNSPSPAIQDTGLNKTSTRTNSSPARSQEYTTSDTGQYSLPSGVYTGVQYPGMYDGSQITPKTSHEPMRNQGYALPGIIPPTGLSIGLQNPVLGSAFQSTLKTRGEPVRTQDHLPYGSAQSLPAGEVPTGSTHPGLNDALLRTSARSLPNRTSAEQVPVITTVSSSTSDTSTIMIKPQNSLSTVNTLPSIPLYYQPHVVMQNQLPVLVLRPVLAQDPSNSPQVSSNPKGLSLDSVPLMFPLGSTNVKGNIDDPEIQSRLAPSASDSESVGHPKTEESFPFGVELVSGYASSVTESEIDEKPLRKPVRVDRKQRDTIRPSTSRVTNENNRNKPCDWEFPPANPFVNSYNDAGSAKPASSTVPTTLSQEARSLYDKQGARSKITNKTNPFAPEIPPRTDIPDLSRNNFNSIPKSMLASSDPRQSTPDSHREPEREVTLTHRRRLSSGSMITLLESECEEGPPMDISDVVASQGNTINQPQIFEPSSGPFFKDNSSAVSPSNSLVPARPINQPTSEVSIQARQPESMKSNEEPEKTKPKLPGHVAPLWIPDEQINKCCCCHQKFTLIRRKHHCRGCGKIFCSSCCSQLARLSYLQYRIGRICVFCTNIIKEAMRAKRAQRSKNSPEKAKPTPGTTARNPASSNGHQRPGIQPYSALSMPNSNTPQNGGTPKYNVNSPMNTQPNIGTGNISQPNAPQVVFASNTPGYQPNSISYTDPVTGQMVNAPIVFQPQSTLPGQTVTQLRGNNIPQNQLMDGIPQPRDPASQQQRSQHASVTSSAPEMSESSTRIEPQQRNMRLPLRPAGRIVSWRGGSFSSRLMLQDRRKALAKDLKELPNGVTIQVADELQVIVKKIRVQRPPVEPYLAWCFCSNGLNILNQTEIVILFELKQKEDLFPEEVLRIYKVILDLVKLGNIFKHGNFLAFNSPFLGSTDNAAFLFADDSFKDKLPAIYEDKTKLLYGILVKRPELEITKYLPMRFLLRLGQETKCFPFPAVNTRDRAVVYDGVDAEDKFYQTSFAMNNYLNNTVPEALIPGLIVLKEDAKIVLLISLESQTAVVSLFDRLIVKTHQTATIPLSSDISNNVHEYKVFHQSIVTEEVSFAKSTSLFRDPRVRRQSGNLSVTGLGFLILHLGATSSVMQNHGGEYVDDGAIVYLSKFHTLKLRQSLYEHSNCYFYLGDRFEIVHFELRWLQEQQQAQVAQTSVPYTSQEAPSKEEFPGTATIDVRHSGHTPELKKLANVGVGDVSILIRSFEDRIRRVCMEPLIMQANKMRAGEAKELILRVSLREGMKKWCIGPSNQPMSLIRSLQMALHAVTLAELHNACLELTFDVSIIKQ